MLLEISIKLLKLPLPQRCCQRGDASLGLMNSGSRQILSWFVGVVVSCAKPSFGRGWLSFTTPVLARALFSCPSVSLAMLGSMVWQIRGIPIGGVMSSAAVAVVLGTAELGWLGQHEEHPS